MPRGNSNSFDVKFDFREVERGRKILLESGPEFKNALRRAQRRGIKPMIAAVRKEYPGSKRNARRIIRGSSGTTPQIVVAGARAGLPSNLAWLINGGHRAFGRFEVPANAFVRRGVSNAWRRYWGDLNDAIDVAVGNVLYRI
ncbi:MAG: hypothetical protein F4X64_03025 [Chloroflexi bacterium]|nr:hypothetical protein [Chloroflexota bacterium]